MKKAFMLPAFGGIPFGLLFLTLFFLWLAGIPFMSGMPVALSIMLAGGGFGVIIVPPMYQLKKYPNTEYMITDKRLIIQSWRFKLNTWFAYFGEIKEIGVKVGLVDKLLGTGTVYPITASFPFPPATRFSYTRGSPGTRVHRIYNRATGRYEEFSEMQIWKKTYFRPCLNALKKPYEVQKLFQETIENVRQSKN